MVDAIVGVFLDVLRHVALCLTNLHAIFNKLLLLAGDERQFWCAESLHIF